MVIPPQHNIIPDTVLVSAGLSTPLWLQYVEQGMGLILLFGGTILMLLRIWNLLRELRDSNKSEDK